MIAAGRTRVFVHVADATIASFYNASTPDTRFAALGALLPAFSLEATKRRRLAVAVYDAYDEWRNAPQEEQKIKRRALEEAKQELARACKDPPLACSQPAGLTTLCTTRRPPTGR